MRKLMVVGAAVLGLAILPVAAQAVPIVGQLSLSGSSVRVTADTIDWGVNGPPSGTIAVEGSTSTGYFKTGPYGDLDGALDTLLDLNLLGALPIDGFETVEGTGLNFTLTSIDPCVGGGNCPFPGTPFFFSEFGGSTTVIMSMHGTVVDPTGAPGELSTWTGTFSADFPGMTIAQVVADFNADGEIIAPYSAAKITTDVPEVPEPASMLLLGSGLVGLAAARRRAKKQ